MKAFPHIFSSEKEFQVQTYKSAHKIDWLNKTAPLLLKQQRAQKHIQTEKWSPAAESEDQNVARLLLKDAAPLP